MRVYFLRHGRAEDASGSVTDHDRRLTSAGESQMRDVAEAYRRVGVRPDVILTSPLARARETADIVAEVLGLTDRLAVDDRLSPGFLLDDLQRIVRDHGHAKSLMLVGHQPDLGLVSAHLVGAADPFDIRKGGIVRVSADRVDTAQGTLEWMIPPSALVERTSD